MHEDASQAEHKPGAASVLALLAGIWMLVPGAMRYVWGPLLMGEWRWGEPMWGGWMWNHGMMRNVAPIFWWPWFGLVVGVIVLIGAVMLYRKPGQGHGWGMVIIILSTLNVFCGMGGFLASVLGIIGGALALSWRP